MSALTPEWKRFLTALRAKHSDPSHGDVEALLKMLRGGDLIHVDEVPEWRTEMDASSGLVTVDTTNPVELRAFIQKHAARCGLAAYEREAA